MKANSNIKPDIFIKSKEKTHFNYNIIETTKEDIEGAQRISFDYQYVIIEGKITRDKLITAIIADEYSKDDELALLHNKLINKDIAKYDEYQIFRADVKQIVSLALN